MIDPDGPEQRTAFYDEAFRGSEDQDDTYEEREEELLEVAQTRMLGWAIDKVLDHG